MPLTRRRRHDESRDRQVNPDGPEFLNDGRERPLPKAESDAKASNSHGSIIAASVAVEHAAKTDTPTDRARPPSFQRHQTEQAGRLRRAPLQDGVCPQKAGAETIRGSRNSEKTAHDHRSPSVSLRRRPGSAIPGMRRARHDVVLQVSFETETDQVLRPADPPRVPRAATGVAAGPTVHSAPDYRRPGDQRRYQEACRAREGPSSCSDESHSQQPVRQYACPRSGRVRQRTAPERVRSMANRAPARQPPQ